MTQKNENPPPPPRSEYPRVPYYSHPPEPRGSNPIPQPDPQRRDQFRSLDLRAVAPGKGRLEVHQLGFDRRDFDAEEWTFCWTQRGDLNVLRLEHTFNPAGSLHCAFVEFVGACRIEFIPED